MDKLVLSAVNASYKRAITVAALQGCIVNADLGEWTVHVATFFTDVSPDLIMGFASSHGISKSQLVAAYLLVKTKTGEHNPDLEVELGAVADSPR